MPFSGPIDAPLKEQGFHLFTRQFMLLDLQKGPKTTSNSAGKHENGPYGMTATLSHARN